MATITIEKVSDHIIKLPEGEVIPTSDSTLHFGKGQTDASIELDPGRYIISLQFADGVHVSFGELMSESIQINVE